MRLHDGWQRLCLMLFTLCVLNVSPLPAEPSVTLTIPSDPLPSVPRSLHSSNAPDLILPRADDFMTHLRYGWRSQFTEIESYLPVRTAASTLASFYRAAIYNAEHVWPIALPAHHLKIRHGALTLQLSCKRRTIPWSMVKNLAEVFLKATEEGFTGRFEGRFVWAVTGVTIYVSLRVNALMTV
ncbi:hypothetical protein G7Y79_00079g100360 [Physcia stellaris]|nr:hypothetical protein G7Y79_00079g100360 [Physcia stellaris]